MATPRRIALGWALALMGAATPVFAQTSLPPARGTVAACDDRQPALAVVQTLGINLFVNRANVWVFNYDWSEVDFGSWSKNLELGWQWDETQWAVNMVVHPYHGSLYHTASRANCLNFWESIPITFLGSWTWEFFGETWRPSLNDFWMTGFGGVAVGELLHRLSWVILDEETRGGGRVARELAATAVNPMGGLNRLLRGQWWERRENPVDRLPDSYLISAKVGGRRVREEGTPGSTTSPTVLFDVRLGDFVETEYRAPFDVVRGHLQISPDGGGINEFRAVGRLYGSDLTGAGNRNRHQLVVNQHFDYVNNPVYHFGEQSLEAGLYSRWRTGPFGLRINSRFSGNVVLLGAIDALAAGLGQRDIDYGPGLGAIVELSLDKDGTSYVNFYNRVRYLRSVSGAPADHTILFSGFDLTIPITSRLGVGAYVSRDNRRSYYTDFPKENRSYYETRLYATWNLAHRPLGAP